MKNLNAEGAETQRKEPKLGKIEHTDRGFELIKFCDTYANLCSVAQSSVIYDESLSNPGSSAVWLGAHSKQAHLNREQVRNLVDVLSGWLATGSFEVPPSAPRRLCV